MKSTDICPVCGPSSLVGEDGDCVHCGATMITESVLRQIEAKQRERCAGICKEISEEYGRLSAGQSARVDALRHGLRAIANKARSPAEIIASRVLAADDASTEINQSVGYAVARECERRIRGEK